MPVDRDDAFEQINTALAGVDPAAPSVSKYRPLEVVLAAAGELEPGRVVVATISKAGNFTVRATQSTRAQRAQLLVGVVTNRNELDATVRVAQSAVRSGRPPAVLLLAFKDGEWQPIVGIQGNGADPAPLGRIAEWLGISTIGVEQRPTNEDGVVLGHEMALPLSIAPPSIKPAIVPDNPLVLEPRVRRMLRTAVASRAAVMLVGPPGTGKSQLVTELLDEIDADPGIVGMARSHEPYTVTPDESWSARELVGGETVDDQGHIRFTPGVVLQAIEQDRWLILDEANRADLDRIFGGLLTWLSGQRVTVGRTSTTPEARPIILGWSQTPESKVAGTDALIDPGSGDETVEYLAGTEWRLLGTYNALDAQRVFRFGLALGRRFAHVPVPPPDTASFAEALDNHMAAFEDIRRAARDRIVAIYGAHRALDAAALGPAVFFEIPGYIASAATDAPLDELLAEAYLTSTGIWLARLDDTQLDELEATLAGSTCLGEQWEWVRAQLRSLR